MQQIRATCPNPNCGGVVLTPQAISVTENKGCPELSTYTFQCPKCGEDITKPAPFDVLGLFAVTQGVKWNVIHHAAELDERHTGPALTEDDVANFAIDLALTPDHLISVLAGGDK